MKKKKPKRTRVSLSEDDLKDIKPDSPLYTHVLEQFAAIDEGKPYAEYACDHLQRDGDLEFDDDAAVSLGADDGAYVMGWVWVSDEDLIEEGYLDRCDECAATIPADEPSMVSAHHLPSCSLYEADNGK